MKNDGLFFNGPRKHSKVDITRHFAFLNNYNEQDDLDHRTEYDPNYNDFVGDIDFDELINDPVITQGNHNDHKNDDLEDNPTQLSQDILEDLDPFQSMPLEDELYPETQEELQNYRELQNTIDKLHPDPFQPHLDDEPFEIKKIKYQADELIDDEDERDNEERTVQFDETQNKVKYIPVEDELEDEI